MTVLPANQSLSVPAEAGHPSADSGKGAAVPRIAAAPDPAIDGSWLTDFVGSTHRLAWSPAEIAILRAHYPVGGPAACWPLLPGRRRQAILSKAHELDLNYLTPLKNNIVQRIRKLLLGGCPPREIARQIGCPPRRIRAIKRKLSIEIANGSRSLPPLAASCQFDACALRLSGICQRAEPPKPPATPVPLKQPPWTEAELALLFANYPAGGTTACLPLLAGRSRVAIRSKAVSLSLGCNRRGRTPNALRRPPPTDRTDSVT